MTEPTILCPQCKTQVKLTESLAAPLVEATRRDYERRMAQLNLECAKREDALKQQEQALAKAKAEWRAAEQERFRAERERIADEEARRAELKCQTDLAQRQREIIHLQSVVKSRDEKLADAQRAQALFLQKERALDDQRRELELTVEKRVTESLSAVRSEVRAEVEETLKLKVLEKEQTITSMQKQIELLKRKAEQGSQQLQGEVLELELEALLTSKFPMDSIVPVRKGEGGGDVLQRVSANPGQPCGAILWETKRTKNWSDSWLPKLREDQRNSKADLAVIVSHALPKEVDSFEWLDGVWVTHPRTMIPLATVLRQGLLEVETARRASEGQQTKAEMVYQYLAGPRFRQRVQAIVEAFTCMQEDLEKEKRATLRLWAKRDEQIARVMHATVGMYGDLQGIAGKTIGEIEGLQVEEFELTSEPGPGIQRIA
ncbi:MAG: DUF2130 domain-containing protein [Bryobacteraceae bacterium]